MSIKGWHLLVAVVLAYAIGAMYPQGVDYFRAKAGV